MTRFLYNVARAGLDRLLALERATGEPWSREAAAAALLLDADAGRVRGQRAYAQQWGWTYSAVRWAWPEISAEAARLATADGRVLDSALARRVPPEWLEAAGFGANGAETGPDGAERADPQRTPESGDVQQRTGQRTHDAPDSAEIRPDGNATPDLQRTQQRSHSAPDSAHLTIPPSPSLHPSQPTDQPAHARDDGEGSVGQGNDEGSGIVSAVVGALRAANETDPNLGAKVRALIDSHGADLVRRQLDGIVRQQSGKPFGFGLLRDAVTNPQRYTFAAVVGVELREGERYSDRERERAVEAGASPGHFQQAGFDDRNRPEWMYLPAGPRRAYATQEATGNERSTDPSPKPSRASGDDTGHASAPPEAARNLDVLTASVARRVT